MLNVKVDHIVKNIHHQIVRHTILRNNFNKSCFLLVEETDGLCSGLYMKRDTQPRNEVTCDALAEMITIDWYYIMYISFTCFK